MLTCCLRMRAIQFSICCRPAVALRLYESTLAIIRDELLGADAARKLLRNVPPRIIEMYGLAN